jgi:hypothetical protein
VSAADLPEDEVTIGGLPCDFHSRLGRHYSAWPSDAPDMGVTRFETGRWMATLPMGNGFGETLEDAVRAAAREQHEALRTERHLAIDDELDTYVRRRTDWRDVEGDLDELDELEAAGGES